MKQLLRLPAILGTFLLLTVSETNTQQVPPIACPQYFEYLSYNREFVGRITMQHDPRYQDNVLQVEFSQRGHLGSNYVGSLSLWDDEETVKFNLRNGRPILYRVDFPTPGVLPKLTQLTINDVVVCRATPYPPSSVTLSLSHSLRSNTVPLFSVQPQLPPQFSRPQPQPRPVWQQEQIPEIRQPVPQPAPPLSPPAPPRPAPTVAPRPAPTLPPASRPRPSTGGQSLSQLNDICGREKAITSPLIFHGAQVARGQLPWMVALFERVENGISFFCGGTLISASTVLTAAHCFRFGSRDLPASRAAVSLGRNTLDLVSEGELRQVSTLIIHQEYTPDNFTDADIALLRMSSPVSFGDFIKPICLWNENYRLQLESGHVSYVAGWGADELGNANTRIAKMTDTDIVTESECIRGLKSPESTSRVTDRTICASNKQGAGPCSGDSGGGLMLQEHDVWLLRGVISAGQRLANRCDLTQPVIYTDLARHITWLRQNIWF
ncbi:putative serine protease 42 [Drosophila albomicans]|uniref:Serine protease 42 n=1 Tax=Drosophila albomicans TaxID=7291 RepID=A0A6P8XLJ0_DROAB|nr:putative serine protease 42 [Drosophila albomicans]